MRNILAGSDKQTFTPDNLIGGEIQTNSFDAPIGFECVRGEVIAFENGELSKLTELNKDKAFGVMVHDQKIALSAVTSLSIYNSGTVNSAELSLNGVALSDVIEPLTRCGLLIKKFGA